MNGRPETQQVSSLKGTASVSFIEPEVETSPLRRSLAAAEVVALTILARWRAIVLLFILVLSIWLALQVVLIVSSAVAYLGDVLPKRIEELKQPPSNQIPPKKGFAAISPPPITNCWRDRSLGGDCFKQGAAGQKSPPARLRGCGLPPRFRDCRSIDI
jgi:hypothetical protein